MLITSWRLLKAKLGEQCVDVDDPCTDEPEAEYASSMNMLGTLRLGYSFAL